MLVYAVDRSDLAPLTMPARFKHDIAYFMTPAGDPGAPAELGPGEYWVSREKALELLDIGTLLVYSPLDSQKHAEIVLTEEQEDWLQWMVDNDVRHIRLAP